MVNAQPYLLINSVNLSTYVRSCEVSWNVDEVDNTTGATLSRTVEGGLQSWRITATFKQVFGAGAVHATLLAAHGTVVAIEYRTDVGTVTASNPKATGNALIKYTRPGGGAIGVLNEATAEIIGSGTLTWANS